MTSYYCKQNFDFHVWHLYIKNKKSTTKNQLIFMHLYDTFAASWSNYESCVKSMDWKEVAQKGDIY